MMKSIIGLFATENILTKILSCYDLMTPLNSFMQGCLSLTGLIYYVTITALFLFLTTQSIQKRRFTVSVKKLKLGVFNAGFVAVAVALAVFVNLFAMELPSTYMEIDVTSSKLYSITEDTKNFLKELDKDVHIYVIAAEDSADTTVAETLKRYEDTSSHIIVEYKDPAVNPNFYQEYTEEAVSVGSLIVVCGEVSKVVDYYELFETTVDYNTYSQQTTGYDGEGQITSALQYVTNENMPVIYQITGHGEYELSGDFLKAVEKSNVTLNSMNLLEVDAVPEDARAVIINGPSADFSKDDADKVIAYMQAGGNVLVTSNYEAQDLPNFERILAEYEMSLVKGVIAEGDSAKYYQNPFYLLPDVASTEYTGSVEQYVFVPYTRGITYPESAENITYTPLLTTSEQAVSKTDAANATSYEFEEGDVQGPFHVAVAATKTAEEETAGQLIVLGATDVLTETADQMVAGSNSAMFTDILSSFVDTEGEASIVIPAKSYEEPQLVISAWVVLLAGLSVMILLPVVFLAIGIVIWAKRRKR